MKCRIASLQIKSMVSPFAPQVRIALGMILALCAGGSSSVPLQVLSAEDAQYVPTLKFDLAAIRECPPGPHSNGFNSPMHSGRLSGTGLWAAQLIGWAYGVDYHNQVLGGPDWIRVAMSNEVRFDVQATSSSEADDRLAKLNDSEAKLEKEHMLQALLEERFRLETHFETRQEPAFAMMVAKSGPKLAKGEPMGPKPENAAPGTWYAPIGSHRDPRGIEIVAHGASMGDLIEMLGFYTKRQIIDQTGISGTYNFTLQFSGTLSDMKVDDGSAWMPMETAIRDQLGLSLKDTRAPLHLVVVDHIEMPSPN